MRISDLQKSHKLVSSGTVAVNISLSGKIGLCRLFFHCSLFFTFFSLISLPLIYAASGDVLIVDDFNASDPKELKNKFGGGIHPWQSDPNDESQWCRISLDRKNFVGKEGCALKIDYNIASNKVNYVGSKDTLSPSDAGFHSDAYNGFYLAFDNQNFSSYKYLVFSIKGDDKTGFSKKFKLEMKDSKRGVSYIVNNITEKWQKCFIPLDHIASAIDLKEVREITVVFDSGNMTRPQGVMYMDDIYFTKNRDVGLYGSAVLSSTDIRYTHSPLKIDGDLKEWKKITGIELKSDVSLESGKIRDKKDLSATAWFQWDERFFYLAVKVKDNEILCLKTGDKIYQSDSIELFIDPEMDGVIWGNPADFQIGFSPNGPNGTAQAWSWFQNEKPSLENIKYVGKTEKNGYVIEAAVSWNYLYQQKMASGSGNVSPAAEDRIGISVAVSDLDSGDKVPHAKLNWHFLVDGEDSKKFRLDSFQFMGEQSGK